MAIEIRESCYACGNLFFFISYVMLCVQVTRDAEVWRAKLTEPGPLREIQTKLALMLAVVGVGMIRQPFTAYGIARRNFRYIYIGALIANIEAFLAIVLILMFDGLAEAAAYVHLVGYLFTPALIIKVERDGDDKKTSGARSAQAVTKGEYEAAKTTDVEEV